MYHIYSNKLLGAFYIFLCGNIFRSVIVTLKCSDFGFQSIFRFWQILFLRRVLIKPKHRPPQKITIFRSLPCKKITFLSDRASKIFNNIDLSSIKKQLSFSISRIFRIGRIHFFGRYFLNE